MEGRARGRGIVGMETAVGLDVKRWSRLLPERGRGCLGCLCVSAGWVGLSGGLFVLTNIDWLPAVCQAQGWALGQSLLGRERTPLADESLVGFKAQV